LFNQQTLNEGIPAMTALTPTQVLERRRQVLVAQDLDGFIDLFAPDGVIELPFGGPGLPSRLEGQQAIREFSSRTVTPSLRVDALETTALYPTDDPEVVVTEIVTRATHAETGRSFSASSIQVFRIKNGKIVLFRDYFSPHAADELAALSRA
jgi:uncharacterized protein